MLKLNSQNAWVVGSLIIILFVILSEGVVTFNNYVYARLGLNRNIVLILLWALPCFASYLVAYYSHHKLLSLLLIPALAVTGALIHYINGQLGGVVDFSGIDGVSIVLKIYLIMGCIIILPGIILGILFSQ
jgi:hypothetical protein